MTSEKHGRAVLRRVLGMGVAWMLMGLMLGLVSGQGTGAVSLAAALTAGVIIMTPVGLVLAALGGRADESLLGGMIGMALGMGAAVLAHQDPRPAAAGGLTCGAFLGATVVTVFYRLPRTLGSHLFGRSEEVPATH